MNRSLARFLYFTGALAGLLLAIAGMFTFNLRQIVLGLVLYVISGYLWEQREAKRGNLTIDR